MPRVVVIDADEWISNLLAGAVRDEGYEVAQCASADEGVRVACSFDPDCIVCDLDLGEGDRDGFWVARTIRAQPSRVSVAPFLFLANAGDEHSHLQGFHVGGDVYMDKPFRVEEVLAQISALVQMAARFRIGRESLSAPSSDDSAAIEGELSEVSVSTLLTVLEMEKRCGMFEVKGDATKAHLEIAKGFILDASLNGAPSTLVAALRAMLTCKSGRFIFSASPPRDLPDKKRAINALLLEAVHLDEETAPAEIDRPPTVPPATARPVEPPRVAKPPPPAEPASDAPIEIEEVEADLSSFPPIEVEPDMSSFRPPEPSAPKPKKPAK